MNLKNFVLGEEYSLDMIGNWDPTLTFKLEEACSLMCRQVIKIEDRQHYPNPPTDKIGLVLGVLAVNDEIEVLVKFGSDMEQLIKAEFCGDYILVPE